MSNRKVVYVVPYADGDWAVKSENSRKPSGVFENKSDAIDRAKEIAKNAPLDQIRILNKHGFIQTEHTYGKDPEKYPG